MPQAKVPRNKDNF